jgi:hypothetical protein
VLEGVRNNGMVAREPLGVSWKSRVIGFGHAELDIGDADIAEIARLYKGHIPVL